MFSCCTYFDARYLTRGLALYRSLVRQGTPFHAWMLCLDEESLACVKKLALPGVSVLSNADLQRHCPQLKEAEGNRSRFEYYATVKAFLLRMLLEQHEDIDRLFFLDADFVFFADPALLMEEMHDAAVLLSPHRLTPTTNKKTLDHGTFNAGFVAFRRDGGMEPLRWWCDRVFEWCGDVPKGDLFADQGYLDHMMKKFPSVVATQHPGVNVAPWNLDERPLREREGRLTVDGSPLIFVHFHGLRRLSPGLYDTGSAPYHTTPSMCVVKEIYRPYIRELRDIGMWLRKEHGFRAPTGSARTPLPSVFRSPGLLLSRIRRRQWLLILE